MNPRQTQHSVFSLCAGRLLSLALLTLLVVAGLTVQRPLEAGSQFGRVDDWQVGQAGIVVRETLARGLQPSAPASDGDEPADAGVAVDQTARLPRNVGAATFTSSSPAPRLLAPGIRPQSPRAPPSLV